MANDSTTASPNSVCPEVDYDPDTCTYGTSTLHDLDKQRYVNPYGNNWDAAIEKLESTAQNANFGEP